MEFLISRGHNYNDILYKYSIDQIIEFQSSGYYNLNAQNEGNIKSLAIAMRYSYHSSAKEFKEYISGNEKKPKRNRKPTKEEIAELEKGFKGGFTKGNR